MIHLADGILQVMLVKIFQEHVQTKTLQKASYFKPEDCDATLWPKVCGHPNSPAHNPFSLKAKKPGCLKFAI